MMPRSPRPGKLRTQVLAGVLLITLGALAVFDVAAVTALRTYLIDRTNVTLKSALTWTRPQLTELLPRHQDEQVQAALPVFGEYYLAFVPARGQVVNLQGGPGLAGPVLSAQAAAKIVRPDRAKAGAKAPPGFAVIQQYQVSAVSVPALSGTLVAGTDLKDVDATVDRVRLIVATGSVAVAVLIFLGVGLVMRRGPRPIEVMASQADRITAGDLTDRVDPAEAGSQARSEVGRLGAALNGMLARIQASVAERDASQELMRRFLAEASHELRTPLASLRANAELYFQGALSERPQVDEAMRRIMLEAQRMGRLVDDMLRLARLDQHPARQRDPVDVSALAAGCVERSRIADPRRTWQARIAPGLVAVGDEEMLCRAVDNLLANVHAHTPEGTTAVVTGYADGDRVVVEVSDDGPGVPGDRLPRIFDRFYRAGSPAHRPGSGLGLAIVTEIAAAHDGTVTAAASWPRGLRVTLAVPAAGGLGRPGAALGGLGRPGAEILTTTERLQGWALVSHWACFVSEFLAHSGPLPCRGYADGHGRVRVDRATLQPYQRGPWHFAPLLAGHLCWLLSSGSGRHHRHDGAPDPDLVPLLQPLGGDDAAAVEPGAVGRAEVFDVPQAVRGQEEGVVAGGMLVVDHQRALAPRGELGVEDTRLAAGLDDDRRGGTRVGEGGVARGGNRGNGGPPGLLLLLGGVFPRRQGPWVSAAVSLVGGAREAVEVGAGHPIDNARVW